MTSTAPMRCKCRKQAETGLRCSRCFVPICPDCSRPASVGMLCNACARGTPSHLYQIDARSFAVAVPVTLAAAVFGGWLMATIVGMQFFAAFAGYLYGMGVGELALRLTGRKRGVAMEVMAGACVVLGLIGGYAVYAAVTLGGMPHSVVQHGIAGAQGVADAIPPTALLVHYLANPWTLVMAVVSVFGAVSRVRTIG